jgi:aminomethyltransferase
VKLAETGVDRKLVGVFLEGNQLRAELSEVWPVFSGGREVGRVTDGVWSRGLEKNIGYAWVPIDLAVPGTTLEVRSEYGEEISATTTKLPFVDPEKRVPAQKLAG